MTDPLSHLQQLPTVLVGTDRARLDAMSELLRRAGLDVTRHTDADAAARDTEKRRVALLLVDSMVRAPEAVMPGARLVLMHHRPRTLVLLDPPHTADTQRWVAGLGERGLNAHILRLGSPYSILESLLPLLVATPTATPTAPVTPPRDPEPSRPPAPLPPRTRSPDAGPADAEGAAFVINLWARRHSGVLKTPRGQARLAMGQPVDPDSRRLMLDAMYTGGASFSAEDAPDQHALLNAAPAIWEALSTLADPPLVLQRADHILVERSMAPRVRELPLPAELRRLLSNLKPNLTLKALSVTSGLTLEQVAGPLSALVRGGFYQLRPAPPGPNPTPVAPSAPPPPRTLIPMTTLSGSDASDPRVAERLRREWVNVQDADDWTALGVAAESPKELVGRALDRLEKRYSQILEASTDPQTKDLARNLLDRAREAAARIREGRAQSGQRQESQHRAAFEQGLKAVEREDWALAVRWFHAARELLPHSALYSGYLGWALYHSPNHDPEKRRAKGRELLELADASADPVAELQCFLVIVEADAGEVEAALSRAERAARLFPNHPPARVLAERLRRDLRGRPGR